MKRIPALLAAVALVVVALVSCSSNRAVIRVGALYPHSGAQGAQGTEEARGVALAAEWANTHGGARGRSIELVAADVPRPEAVPKVMAKLRSEGAWLVVGSHGSEFSAVAADVATREDMLFWETGAVGEIAPDVAGGRNFFRLAPMGANLGRAAIAFMSEQYATQLHLGRPLRFAVAHVDDAYGRAVGLGAADEVRARGGDLVGTFSYPANETAFDGLADRIASARPDVLFVSAYLEDGVALRAATVRRHVPLAASIGTSSSYCLPAFGGRLGADAVGLFASDKPDADDVRADALAPEGRAALEWVSARYQAQFQSKMPAPALSGFSNAFALFSHVLPKAAGLTRPAVAQAALELKLPEGSLANGGGVDLVPPGAPDGGANRAAAGVIWEWVAPATRAVVWPPTFATHPIVKLPLT